ncbi:nucleotidyl transferase AbiEii/AbiGii toxin family protein [Prosthecochloris sp.]|uniref:nucleotidyl transferase AbiEii/AbiGii toxin family protein n=1 Tax=Prosthecochloris sp. TaxID=290513 RepID=UPI0025E63276|nr:nucleotidyl transferase AbiEii/AbiGii toxin family protein [Prosthecochloris sp.]
MTVLKQMLEKYDMTMADGAVNGLREVVQEVALAGLYRGGFFDKAAFYGGTCLRIFYGLPRFSEDLDFSLLESDADFSLEPYFKVVREEFSALGLQVEMSAKKKTVRTGIESAFLKSDTRLFSFAVHADKIIKIKFEVDTEPPLGFATEEKLLLQPFSFYVKCFSLPDLFAGKMHALLFRNWKNRVKGRDWFDFEWYVRKSISMNLSHFGIRAKQSGNLQGENLTEPDFRQLLHQRIDALDVVPARNDVSRFVKDVEALKIWSRDYFHELAKRMHITVG